MWRCRGLAYVVHDEFVTGFLKIGRHAGTHDSQSDKSYLHVGILLVGVLASRAAPILQRTLALQARKAVACALSPTVAGRSKQIEARPVMRWASMPQIRRV